MCDELELNTSNRTGSRQYYHCLCVYSESGCMLPVCNPQTAPSTSSSSSPPSGQDRAKFSAKLSHWFVIKMCARSPPLWGLEHAFQYKKYINHHRQSPPHAYKNNILYIRNGVLGTTLFFLCCTEKNTPLAYRDKRKVHNANLNLSLRSINTVLVLEDKYTGVCALYPKRTII